MVEEISRNFDRRSKLSDWSDSCQEISPRVSSRDIVAGLFSNSSGPLALGYIVALGPPTRPITYKFWCSIGIDIVGSRCACAKYAFRYAVSEPSALTSGHNILRTMCV